MSDTQPQNHDAPRPTPEAAVGMVLAGRWRLTKSLSTEPAIWETTDSRLDDRRLLLVILPKVDVASATATWGALQAGTLLTLIDVLPWPPTGSAGVFVLPSDASARANSLLSRETLSALLCEHAATLQRAQSLPLAVRVCTTPEPWVATLGAPRLLALPLPGTEVDKDRRADREQFIFWLAAALQGFQGGSAVEALATFPDTVRRVVEPWLQDSTHAGYAIDPALLASALQVQAALPRAPIPASRAPQRPVPSPTPWGTRRSRLSRRIWIQLCCVAVATVAVPMAYHNILMRQVNSGVTVSEVNDYVPPVVAQTTDVISPSPIQDNPRQSLWMPWMYAHPTDMDWLDPTQFTGFDPVVIVESSADGLRSMVYQLGELQRREMTIETRLEPATRRVQRFFTGTDQVVQYQESVIGGLLTLTAESGQIPDGICSAQQVTQTPDDQYASRACLGNSPGHVAFGCRTLQIEYHDDENGLPAQLLCLTSAETPMASFTGWSRVTFEWQNLRLVRVDFFDDKDEPFVDPWYGGAALNIRVRPETGERVVEYLGADGLVPTDPSVAIRRLDTLKGVLLSASLETPADASGRGFRHSRTQLGDAPVYVDEWLSPGDEQTAFAPRPRQTWTFSDDGHLTGLTGQNAEDAPVALDILGGAHTITLRYDGDYQIVGSELVYPDGSIREDRLTLDNAGHPTVVNTTWSPGTAAHDVAQTVLTRDLSGQITRRILLAPDGQLATMEALNLPDAAQTAWVWDEEGQLLSITREPDSGTELPEETWSRITYVMHDGIRRSVVWETSTGADASVLHPSGVLVHAMHLEYNPDGRMVAQVLEPSGDRVDCREQLCLDATGLGTVPFWELWMPDVAPVWEFR